MEIKERLKIIRKQYFNLTQAQFGERIGLKPTAIGQMEAGERNITRRTIILICEKYNINEEWLCTGKGEVFDNANDNSFEKLIQVENLDELDKKIIIEYSKLKPDQRKLVRKLLSSMLLDDTLDNLKDKDNLIKENIDKSNNIDRKNFDITVLPKDIQDDIIEAYKQIKSYKETSATLEDDKLKKEKLIS